MDLSELKRSITLCKEGITVADKNLEKLTGRNAFKSDNFNQRPPIKRRINLNDDNDEIKRPKIDRDVPMISSVVQMTKGRTREDAITEIKKRDNGKEAERGRRLFGQLLGTLNVIKKEADKSIHDPQNITRMKIDKKVEENNKIVGETIKKEQEELIRAKKERQNDLKALNQRYRAAEAFERWKAEKLKMKGYIRTTIKPYIFYLPKIINDEARLRIDQTIREIDEIIENRRKRLETEIAKVVKMSENHLTNEAVKPIDISKEMEDERKLKRSEWVSSDEEESTQQDTNNRSVIKRANKFSNERNKSPDAGSCVSEDYEDMIDEIEITMHDDSLNTSQSKNKDNYSMNTEVTEDEETLSKITQFTCKMEVSENEDAVTVKDNAVTIDNNTVEKMSTDENIQTSENAEQSQNDEQTAKNK